MARTTLGRGYPWMASVASCLQNKAVTFPATILNGRRSHEAEALVKTSQHQTIGQFGILSTIRWFVADGCSGINHTTGSNRESSVRIGNVELENLAVSIEARNKMRCDEMIA
jgi:hypothetical protein